MNVGSQIKKYREQLKISQEELADKVFVSRQTISNWENNKNYPDIKSLSLLSYIFNVSIDDFIKGDIEEMRKKVDENVIKEFNLLGIIYTVEMIIMIISAYPLFKFVGVIGISIWVIFTIITVLTALYIEKIKKSNDIQTYKEIIAFCERRSLNRDEKNQEIGKRYYQKIFMAICSGIIAVIVFIIMKLILG